MSYQKNFLPIVVAAASLTFALPAYARVSSAATLDAGIAAQALLPPVPVLGEKAPTREGFDVARHGADDPAGDDRGGRGRGGRGGHGRGGHDDPPGHA